MQMFRLAAPHGKLPQQATQLRQCDSAERPDLLFSPLAVFPEQFYDATRRAAKNRGEVALI